MTAVSLTPAGPFSLAASVRFLEGFTPANYSGTADEVLRLAFPADDGHATVAAAVRQEETADGEAGTVRVEFTVHTGEPDGDLDGSPADPASAGPGPVSPGEPSRPEDAVRAQLARILSLDVDGSGFPELAADPVAAGLMAEFPGLRPVCFHSPYEAAVWAVIGHRIRMTQAAAIKARLAERYGRRVQIAGRTLHAFPTPPVLRAITRVPGLTEVKIERLHALAEAADAGNSTPHDCARCRLTTLSRRCAPFPASARSPPSSSSSAAPGTPMSSRATNRGCTRPSPPRTASTRPSPATSAGWPGSPTAGGPTAAGSGSCCASVPSSWAATRRSRTEEPVRPRRGPALPPAHHRPGNRPSATGSSTGSRPIAVSRSRRPSARCRPRPGS
ncbi:hypothetical protein SSPO_041700 [Streptomyces antimycoticus]|uniref:HhH-GPD domain-containing protein n=1 Tax=Streptomyces antimycoticus TaxID=68175 RepID=A0A499UKU7_9ACTN|nr:hypothetical protein SSPO_041700 [Streptomyces antimycoticus]